ncbi:MAG: aminotransferase class I/II-fold pyridoxal phosphate-dependent enzyme [Solirubrobacteraceae bacterium]|jgi:aromatic-L-amino-acid decarboxylase|nr:aminotransferase class I/II-fold pyridoxal phosphate-dependent enzyme [Solirubrobacteraceae bacterium]
MGFREDGQAAVEWVARYLERLRELPVLARTRPGEIRRRLPPAPPEEPEPFSALLRDMDEIILPGVTHWQHPRFFAYFATTGSEPGILAEMLAASLNNVGFLWRTSPALTELETHVLDWTAQLLGLPSGWHGHIEDTASTSSFAALVAAREAAPTKRVVVCSEHAHSSIEKAARLAGLGIRKVPLDGRYRLRLDALDLAGACACVATVGTTNTTAVDPLPELAQACEREGVWLHVDAAYAGAAMVCPEFRPLWAGIERADSLVVNAHKWLFTPMDCSLFWSRRPEALRHAFSLVPEYLRTADGAGMDLMDYSPVLGRRFRALKLWAVIRCHGRSGLQRLIREHVRLAALFERWVRATPGWEVVAPREFSVVCFRREGSDAANDAIIERVNAGGEAFLAGTTLGGRRVIRLAIGNARTTEADVRMAWEALQRAGA